MKTVLAAALLVLALPARAAEPPVPQMFRAGIIVTARE